MKNSLRNLARDDVLKSFGMALRLLRREKGLSQEALANLAEIDRSYLGAIERGEHNIALINISKLVRVLDCSVSDLMQIAGL